MQSKNVKGSFGILESNTWHGSQSAPKLSLRKYSLVFGYFGNEGIHEKCHTCNDNEGVSNRSLFI